MHWQAAGDLALTEADTPDNPATLSFGPDAKIEARGLPIWLNRPSRGRHKHGAPLTGCWHLTSGIYLSESKMLTQAMRLSTARRGSLLKAHPRPTERSVTKAPSPTRCKGRACFWAAPTDLLAGGSYTEGADLPPKPAPMTESLEMRRGSLVSIFPH